MGVQYEMIGKVRLDLGQYPGSDLYSDGGVEDEMLAAAQSEGGISSLIEKDSRWAVLYHCSPIRENLLEWYDFHPGSSVLEIGAGCGALTGVLCRKCAKVTAVDLSRKRCLINAYRNINRENLELLAANFSCLSFDKRFDYVTAVGVLEYAGIYMPEGENPFERFLLLARDMLAPGGRLLIAIENKLGLKYWNGAKEDHAGRAFEGIQDYPSGLGARTFSKSEMKSLLDNSGFRGVEFYYPYPDYKMPFHIFSDRYLPVPGSMFHNRYNYDFDRLDMFGEGYAWDSIIKASLFSEFSNSFLIVACRDNWG